VAQRPAEADPSDAWFCFGHQGYEYVDLVRVWQLLLLVGLFLGLALLGRALWPAPRRLGPHRSLLVLFLISSLAIAAFYAAGIRATRRVFQGCAAPPR
jgi:nitric oxide reductase subunit B